MAACFELKSRATMRDVFVVALFLVHSGAIAHGGGLNAEGCHNERRTGGYHCHRAASITAPAPRLAADQRNLPPAPTSQRPQIIPIEPSLVERERALIERERALLERERALATPRPSVPATQTLVPQEAPLRSGSPTCHVGPRGGTYTITASGRKNYGGC